MKKKTPEGKFKFGGSVFRILIHWLRIRIHGFDNHKKWKKFTAENKIDHKLQFVYP